MNKEKYILSKVTINWWKATVKKKDNNKKQISILQLFLKDHMTRALNRLKKRERKLENNNILTATEAETEIKSDYIVLNKIDFKCPLIG